MTSLMKVRVRGMLARIAVLALVAGGMTAIVMGPARADDFNPENHTPVVTSVTGGLTVSPGATGSGEIDVNATVADADSLLDLNAVSLNFFNVYAMPTPSTNFSIVWDRATETFSVDSGSSIWAADLGSGTTTYTATGTSMVVNFRFKISSTAKAGTWTARVSATDMSTAWHQADGAANTVNYYSSITTRAPQANGTVAAAGTSLKENISDGTIVANGSSKVTMSQTAFAGTGGNAIGTSAGIMTGTPATAVTATNVALDCGNASTYAGSASPFRLTTSAQDLITGQHTTPTVEAGSTALVNSCRLTSGGQLPVGEYTATVTTGIGSG